MARDSENRGDDVLEIINGSTGGEVDYGFAGKWLEAVEELGYSR